ncbi:MAG: hypothetical protein JNK02_17235 [Planctomycetes bacterium]|nr:hypothetical protein [Planctomycetota bacterium]
MSQRAWNGALVAALLCALPLVGCRRDPSPTPTASTGSTAAAPPASAVTGAATAAATSQPTPKPIPPPVGDYAVAPDGAQSITVNGLRIETAADLPERAASAQVSIQGDNQVGLVLRGWPIAVKDGRVLVAGIDYGAAPAAGGHIRLGKDGVFVEGELRGPLP